MLGWRAEGELVSIPPFLNQSLASPLGFPWVNIRLGQEGACGDSFGKPVWVIKYVITVVLLETRVREIQIYYYSCYGSSLKRYVQPALIDPPTFVIVGKHFERLPAWQLPDRSLLSFPADHPKDSSKKVIRTSFSVEVTTRTFSVEVSTRTFSVEVSPRSFSVEMSAMASSVVERFQLQSLTILSPLPPVLVLGVEMGCRGRMVTTPSPLPSPCTGRGGARVSVENITTTAIIVVEREEENQQQLSYSCCTNRMGCVDLISFVMLLKQARADFITPMIMEQGIICTLCEVLKAHMCVGHKRITEMIHSTGQGEKMKSCTTPLQPRSTVWWFTGSLPLGVAWRGDRRRCPRHGDVWRRG